MIGGSSMIGVNRGALYISRVSSVGVEREEPGEEKMRFLVVQFRAIDACMREFMYV